MTELTGPFVNVKSTGELQIATAPVLVPGEPDSDGEILTPEKISEVALGWMEKYRNIDIQHSLVNVAIPVESYILPFEMVAQMEGKATVIPKGSWMMSVKIPDPAIWAKVKSGELSGFSIMGVSRNTLNNILASGKSFESASKRTLLADLGPDWEVTHNSIVDRPAVPKAKWIALKSAPLPFDQVVSQSVEKFGRTISESTYALLEQATNALTALLEKAKGERAQQEKKKNKNQSPGLSLELTFGEKNMTETITPTTETAGASVKMDSMDTQYLIRSAIQAELEPVIVEITAKAQSTLKAVIQDAIKPVTDTIAILHATMQSQATLNEDHAKAMVAMKAKVDAAEKAIETATKSAEAAKTELSELVVKAIEDRFGKKSSGTSNSLKGQDEPKPATGPIVVKGEQRDAYGRSITQR